MLHITILRSITNPTILTLCFVFFCSSVVALCNIKIGWWFIGFNGFDHPICPHPSYSAKAKTKSSRLFIIHTKGHDCIMSPCIVSRCSSELRCSTFIEFFMLSIIKYCILISFSSILLKYCIWKFIYTTY